MKKLRIDRLLVESGIAETEAKAKALVMSGVVIVDNKRVEKPSEIFVRDKTIRLKGEEDRIKFVGRGGLKLEKALDVFNICVSGYVCLDIGASTGGFTDCLLQNGAKKIYAVDAGTNQLVWKLRNDERVVVREKTNARYLEPEDFDDKFDLIVIDVSFISIRKLFSAIKPLMRPEGKIIALIKPQFEVGRDEVEKGGVVRDNKKHEQVIIEINTFANKIGFQVEGITDSPILGAAGNKEFLVKYGKRQ